MVNSVEPGQTPGSKASDLDLHFLPKSVSRVHVFTVNNDETLKP